MEDDINYDDNVATDGDIDLTIECDDGTMNPAITGIFTVNITDAVSLCFTLFLYLPFL